jgi:hypothetical protein
VLYDTIDERFVPVFAGTPVADVVAELEAK